MDGLLFSMLHFLAILNPFALCLYLAGVMDDLESHDFKRVLTWASVISLAVFWLFALAGETLLVNIIGVRPAALRAFGGVIFFVIAYNYVTKGYKAAVILRGSLDELHSAIALPYMIGAGTITQSILVGEHNGPYFSMLIIFLALLITLICVQTFKFVRDRLRDRRERLFERYVNILCRINGLLIGAISTEMVVSGVHKLWLNG